MRDVDERVIDRELEMPLKSVDIERLAKEAGDLSEDLSKTELTFKQVKAEWTERVKGLKGALNKTLQVIKRRKESRIVSCTERKIYAECKVQYVVDGEVIEERAMTVSELQPELDLTADGNSHGAGIRLIKGGGKKMQDDLLDDEESDFADAQEDKEDTCSTLPEPVESAKEDALTDQDNYPERTP